MVHAEQSKMVKCSNTGCENEVSERIARETFGRCVRCLFRSKIDFRSLDQKSEDWAKMSRTAKYER